MTNLSISDELNLLSEALQRCLSPQALHQLAKEVGFVQRTSKYRAQDLVVLCVWFSHLVEEKRGDGCRNPVPCYRSSLA